MLSRMAKWASLKEFSLTKVWPLKQQKGKKNNSAKIHANKHPWEQISMRNKKQQITKYYIIFPLGIFTGNATNGWTQIHACQIARLVECHCQNEQSNIAEGVPNWVGSAEPRLPMNIPWGRFLKISLLGTIPRPRKSEYLEFTYSEVPTGILIAHSMTAEAQEHTESLESWYRKRFPEHSRAGWARKV